MERQRDKMATLYRIPKEIKGENKIALNMNGKQLIACGIGIAIDLAVYYTMHLELDQMLMVTLVSVGGALIVSSKSVDGVSVPFYAFDYVRKIAFRYDRRVYRTKNRVISALNLRYSELRAKDDKDKKTAKKKKADKRLREKKKSKLNAIY